MDDDHLPILIPHELYVTLLEMDPGGAYGISYDVYTRKTVDDLPAGWNLNSGPTYLELARILGEANFRRKQYSDWASDASDAADTYWTMLNLLRIRPPGKLESTIKGLKAHHIPSWELDVTEKIRLGGAYSPHLRGPTPANLVPDNVPSAIPDDIIPLPDFTKPSANAFNPACWRVPL
ncbi:hypothetical protein JVU11DRAFT_6720 [Chiua virens]|nr:hypothetical protein JVU11DRAFT_6720 [Chiua virens]